MNKVSVPEYFRRPDTLRPVELVYGVVREPAMPDDEHQRIATRPRSSRDHQGADPGSARISWSK